MTYKKKYKDEIFSVIYSCMNRHDVICATLILWAINDLHSSAITFFFFFWDIEYYYCNL